MNCPKCNRENEDSALFCRYCGSSLKPIKKKDSNTSNVILLVWIILIGVFNIGTFLYTRFYNNWYEEGRVVYVAIQIMHNLIMILPSLAIKDKTLKIIGILISICLIIWWVIGNIQFAMQSY